MALIELSGGCEECKNCGIAYKEPVVNMKFFNIDSLNKVNIALVEVEDSLAKVNEEIDNGNTDLIEIKTELEIQKAGLEATQKDIAQGKIKIEEVTGIDALQPLYFRDSTTNDSLTVFPFPLSMHANTSTFHVEIDDRLDTLTVGYLRAEDVSSNFILIRAFDLSVGSSTYDSAKVICNKDSCLSHETTIYVYF